MKKLIIVVVFLAGVALSLAGCGGANPGPDYTSYEEYKNGELNPGFLFSGQSAEAWKEWEEGKLETESKKTALDYWKEGYTLPAEDNASEKIGKMIIYNEASYTMQIGVEGPMSKSWYMDKKQKIRDNLIPGTYRVWFDRGNGKEYSENEFTVDLTTKSFQGETVNGYIVWKPHAGY